MNIYNTAWIKNTHTVKNPLGFASYLRRLVVRLWRKKPYGGA